ncbi:MAG TPA: ROK family protein [Acidimicrobiales bacterium]
MIVGLDVGGTKILGLAVDEHGGVHDELRMPTPDDPRELVDALCDLATQLVERPAAVGIGIAGLIGHDGRVRVSPHLVRPEELDIIGVLTRALGVPVTIDNDANAAAWGEARVGAARGVDHMVFVTLGTGIGSGIVVNGRLVRGANGFGGEAGHMVVDRRGATHVTGLPGAWEMYGSGSALDEMTRAAGVGESGEDLHQKLLEGDDAAFAVLDRYAWEVAVGVANLLTVLDPHLVVLGGGVSEIGEPLRAAVERHLPSLLIGASLRAETRVALAQLGERAGAIGAALLATELVS